MTTVLPSARAATGAMGIAGALLDSNAKPSASSTTTASSKPSLTARGASATAATSRGATRSSQVNL